MAIEIQVYAPKVDDLLVKPWLDRLLKLGMQCDIYPAFSFTNHQGYLPFRLHLLNPTRESFRIGNFLSGFELTVDDFNPGEFRASQQIPKRGLLSFFKCQSKTHTSLSPAAEAILNNCRKRLTFRFSPADVFELRLADISSIILMELSNGVRYLPSDNQWHHEIGFAEDSLSSIEDFERSLPEDGYATHPFEGWPE